MPQLSLGRLLSLLVLLACFVLAIVGGGAPAIAILILIGLLALAQILPAG